MIEIRKKINSFEGALQASMPTIEKLMMSFGCVSYDYSALGALNQLFPDPPVFANVYSAFWVQPSETRYKYPAFLMEYLGSNDDQILSRTVLGSGVDLSNFFGRRELTDNHAWASRKSREDRMTVLYHACVGLQRLMQVGMDVPPDLAAMVIQRHDNDEPYLKFHDLYLSCCYAEFENLSVEAQVDVCCFASTPALGEERGSFFGYVERTQRKQFAIPLDQYFHDAEVEIWWGLCTEDGQDMTKERWGERLID